MNTEKESGHWEMSERLAQGVVMVRSRTVLRVYEAARERAELPSWWDRVLGWLGK